MPVAAIRSFPMKREEVGDVVQRGIDELSEALAAGKSDRLKAYLAVMARFHKYSFQNCVLIWSQFSEATFVQGFHAWKKLGRSVKKGAKGIGIIAPMVYRSKDERKATEAGEKVIRGFKVVHVFDISQTEGDDLPEFATISGDPGNNIAAVEQLIRSHGIELLYEDIEGGADGLSKKGTIVIANDLPPARVMLTLIHELSHEFLHASSERRRETTKTVRETEAEAVAFVVGSALGVDCVDHSSDYIQLYNGNAELLAQSMEHIQKTAARILEGIGGFSTSDDVQAEEVTS
jgi:hypothetical protein